MATYLQLCQKAARECGITTSASIPAAVTGQTGELKQIVDWVADAWVDIQNASEQWRWMKHGFTLNTVSGTAGYAFGSCTDTTTSSAITRFGRWHIRDDWNPPKIYLTSDGVGSESWLTHLDWYAYNSLYGIGTQNNNRPVHITDKYNDELHFGQIPDADYTVTGEYFRSAQILSADSDEPEMPSQFHDLIVYIVMQKYGLLESAPEVVARGEQEAKRLMKALRKNQLGRWRMGGSLA